MTLRSAALASAMLLAGCSDGSNGTTAPPVATPGPTPTPAPTPSPTPSPAPSPTPSPTPSPSPSPSYTRFEDLFADRSFQSTCSGFILPGDPPAVLPATAFGRGLNFVFVSTPQIYNIGGDGLSLSFGSRDVDANAPAGVTAYVKTTGADTERFSISRPAPDGIGLDYARFASVSAPRAGTTRLYQCVIGVPTLTTDLPDVTVGGGTYPRTVFGATAYLRDTATARPFSTGRSTLSFAADFSTRRVTMTLVVIGTPLAPPGPDVPFGTFQGVGAIDPLTGNFEGSWSSTDRVASGNFGGRFFGPQAREFGISLGITGPESGSQRAFSIAGTAFGSASPATTR